MSDTLFFLASKLFWLVARPESLLLLLMALAALALARHRVRAARRLVIATLALVLVLGLLPIGQLLLRPLEERFPVRPEIVRPAAIIVLGGGEDARMSAGSGLPELNAAGERLVAALALARRHPQAALIFTGGSPGLPPGSMTGADVARELFAEFGVAAPRVRLEPRARNTAENATRTRALVDDPARGPWVLVTSAFHMPRAVGSFCAAGWRNLVPYPVDHRAAAPGGALRGFAGTLDLVDIATKEWIGLAVYAATGRTPALLPERC